MSKTPRYLTTRAAAELCGLRHDYLRALLSQGRGPKSAGRAATRGRPLLFTEEEIERWQASRLAPQNEAAADPNSLPPLA